MSEPILVLDRLSRSYRRRSASTLRRDEQRVIAAKDVSLTVGAGEFVALVGESGSGKSTVCRLALRLEKPDDGRVLFAGKDLALLPAKELRSLRRRMQAIFQDPLSSMNPRWRVAESMLYPLRVHGLGDWPSYDQALRTLFDQVSLDPRLAGRYPHELSGGQRQRVCIARALATKPDLVIADEAISGLDVSTQLEILGLLIELKRELGMGFLFVTHDLRTVRQVADRVAVMYRGALVEDGPTVDVFERPSSEYAKRLVGSLLTPRFELNADEPDPAGPNPNDNKE